MKNCYFSGKITSSSTSIYTFSGGSISSANNCYYNNASGMIPSNTIIQGNGLTNFGTMASLPSGFSSDIWQIVDGYPELKIFIK